MADGKPPPPPLSPHEEGENPNIKVNVFQPKLNSINSRISSVFNKEPPTTLPPPPQEGVEKSQTVFSPFQATNASTHLSTSPTADFTYIGSHKIDLASNYEATTFSLAKSSVVGLNLTDLSNRSIYLPPPSFHNGKPAVFFRTSDKKRLIEAQNFLLIAKFSHRRPPLESLKQFFFSQHLQGSFILSVYDSKHIIIEFVFLADFVKCWLKQNLVIHGCPVRFFKWTENFHPSLESSTYPVWIHLPGLPLYLYEEGALLLLASAFGFPLYIDPNNMNRKKLSYASFCVEWDVLKAPIEDLWVAFDEGNSVTPTDGFLQKVVYDKVPSYCSFCSHLGHSFISCKRRSDLFHEQNLRYCRNQMGTGYFLGATTSEKELAPAVEECVAAGAANSVVDTALAAGEANSVGDPSTKRFINAGVNDKKGESNLEEGEILEVDATLVERVVKNQDPQNQVLIGQDEVLIEDLTLEEGELPVTAVSAEVVNAGHAPEVVSAGNAGSLVTAPEAIGGAPAHSTAAGAGTGSAGAYAAGDVEAVIAGPAVVAGATETAGTDGKTATEPAQTDFLGVTSGKNVAGQNLQQLEGAKGNILQDKMIQQPSNVELQTKTKQTADHVCADQECVCQGSAAQVYATQKCADQSTCLGKGAAAQAGETELAESVAQAGETELAAGQNDAGAGELFAKVLVGAVLVKTEEAVQDMQARRDDFVVQNTVLQEAVVLQDESCEQNTGPVVVAGTEEKTAEKPAQTETDGSNAAGQIMQQLEGAHGNKLQDIRIQQPSNVQLQAKPKQTADQVSTGSVWAADGFNLSTNSSQQEQVGRASDGLRAVSSGESMGSTDNAILEWDAAQVRAFVHNQIEEIKQEIGQTEPKIRDAAKQAKKAKKERERKNLKEYFMASAEKINSDLERKRSEQKGKTTGNSFKYGEG